MIAPLCSVLLPSLWRFDKMLNAVRSFYETADDIKNIQMIVRLHWSDAEAFDRAFELRKINDRIIYFFGPDKENGAGNEVLWNSMLRMARGEWYQFWSDDMRITGRGWDAKLREVPTEGFVAHPEIHKLNESLYSENIDGPAPFVPAQALYKFGYQKMPEVPDVFFHDLLIKRHGWKPWFLRGIGVDHQRVEDKTTAIANA